MLRLSDNEIAIIENEINKYSSIYCDYHDLKTRRSGPTKHVDLHLVVPEDMSIKDAHDICDKIEYDIETILKNTHVMIHLESSDKNKINL